VSQRKEEEEEEENTKRSYQNDRHKIVPNERQRKLKVRGEARHVALEQSLV
jgi:hypothetical protein